jgi:acetaldehyde dehydrogenase / alcohol dehydrogenase
VGNSLGSAGLETGLAPTMTIGTGFFGRSSVGENLHPGHLVQWTRLAYNRDPAEPFGDFTGLSPWAAPAGAVPQYPVASNQRERPLAGADRGATADRGTGAEHLARSVHNGFSPDREALRDEIRRLILEELAQLAGG